MIKRTVGVALIAGWTGVSACTGDCMTCHPALMKTIQTDARHKPMLTCIKCHSAETDAMAECGSDCFACHSIEKIEKTPIAEHAVIRGCRDCHMKLKKALTDIASPKDQSTLPTLKEMLVPDAPSNGLF